MQVRLQRYLADCGVASRRACEQLITAGRVLVNGVVRSEMPVLIDPDHDVVMVNEQVVSNKAGDGVKQVTRGLSAQDKAYYLLNKPKGILVTNFDPSDRKTVGELMAGVKERVFPVGRLDMDGRGALIMTNDGDLANRLTHPRYGVEKTYVVATEGKMGTSDLEKIKKGMWFGPDHPGPTSRATHVDGFKVKVIGRGHGGESGHTLLEVKITESKNRQIRRVMARLGHPVRDLNRVAIAGKITLRGLEVGEYRPLTQEEVKWLYHASSPEYHERNRTATQSWYEQKEQEKERKRLAKEAAKPAAPARRPVGKPKRFGGGKPTRFGDNRPFGGPKPWDRKRKGKARPAFQPPAPKPGSKRFQHPLGSEAQSDD